MSHLFKTYFSGFLFLGILSPGNICNAQNTNSEKVIESTLETISTSSLEGKVVYQKDIVHFESDSRHDTSIQNPSLPIEYDNTQKNRI